MRLRLSIFTAVILALILLAVPQNSQAQTVTLIPSAVPNGVQSASGQQYHQRIDIILSGGATEQKQFLTLTLPPELTLVAGTVTTTSDNGNNGPFFCGTASFTGSNLNFGITNTAGTSVANTTVTIEFDVTTPTSFAGVASGAKVDTVYNINFSPGASQSNRTAAVAKHNDLPIRLISFSNPDSSQGDTTVASGRFFKLGFASSGLLDLSHSGLSGLSASRGFAENNTDITYTFYLSTDSTLIKRPSGMLPAGFVTLGSDRSPLVGTRQDPRVVPSTFVREDYVATFGSSTTADSVNGMISLDGTLDATFYYIYALADPNMDRFPGQNMVAAPNKKGYDPTELGTFTAGRFLGRSGPLLVLHPPEFVVAGWDYDNDGGDAFSATGVIQVPTDQLRTGSSNTPKDNQNITVDTGGFFGKGVTLPSLNSGGTLRPITTVDLLYVAADSDNPQNFSMNIFLATTSGLKVDNLIGAGIDSLDGAIKLVDSDTLKITQNTFTFNPIVRDTTTNLITTFIPENDYFVYFAGTDGTYRTVYQVLDDPFTSSTTARTISVKHAPTLSIDAFSLNDFGGDDDLDVITGIGITQMSTDVDGKNLSSNPASRYVNIFWGGTSGLDGDLDVDDNATIDLYYSTESIFRASGKSQAYTSGNSDGTDLLSHVMGDSSDTHLIVTGLREDPDGLFDNNYQWDLWTFVSPEGTITQTGERYYIYALMRGGTTQRLVSLTETSSNTPGGTPQAINFTHPPYIRATEPSQDITVSVDDPVMISWEAFDVDNGNAGGKSGNPNGVGVLAPDGRTSSPNIRILLTTSDFGEVTTWGTITQASAGAVITPNPPRIWLANSENGGSAAEVELNEGVDTSFVFIANSFRTNPGYAGATRSALLTNSGAGETYFVYLAIDGDAADDGTVGNLPANFKNFSPVVKAPGRITFTGTVPTNPATSPRFIIPGKLTVTSNEEIQIPVVPDSLLGGNTVATVSLFMSVDPALWEAVDTDPGTAGTQPFTLGDNTQISAANVQQGVYTQGGVLRLDFLYDDQITGLTFFDRKSPLVFLNLKAKVASASVTNTTISIDNSGSRQSKMIELTTNQNLGALVPQPISVDIVSRSQVSGVVPLEGRVSSADTVTFLLREVGDLGEVTDSLFALNDADPAKQGVQLITSGVNGSYTLSNVPTGKFILVASARRHLSGKDTINVVQGVDLSNIRPTLDGDGIDRAALLAGDAAGYTDSTGTSVPDNTIGQEDINAINAGLFTQLGESGYNQFADINQDSVINATDKNFATVNMTSNTGTIGTIRPVFPTFKRVVPDGKNTDAMVSLVGLPEGEVKAGEAFDVTVKIDQAVAVRAYEVKLDFDPTKLAVEDVVSNGSLFEHYLADMAGKMIEAGQIGFVNAIIGQTPVGASGEGTLATIRFRSIGRGAETMLKVSAAMLINVENSPVLPQLGEEAMVSLSSDPFIYHDELGNEIRGLILSDKDNRVDFNDFLVLAAGFGISSSSKGYDLRADLNGDNQVNFADFLILSNDFGKIAVDAPSAIRMGKPTPAVPGVNGDANLSLKVDGKAQIGAPIVLTLNLKDAAALQGWGVTLSFDPNRYEFVEATLPEDHLMAGSTTPVFLVHNHKDGTVSLANAISEGAVASGEGVLAQLVFKPRGEFEDVRFEIAEGVLFDPNQLANPASGSVLDVKSVPSQFALAQNFPNPFNPETTISYDLASDSEVQLEIYNVMGQLIRTLIADQQAAGRYRVMWKGDDATGRSVASGVYFYRLHTGEFKAVRKLMLLK